MNISTKIAAGLLFTAAAAFSNTIWSPTTTDFPGQVNNLTGPGGWWYAYSDADSDGGTSTVSWGNEEGEFNTKIEAAGAIDVNFTLAAGFDYPFAGVGFNWLSEEDGGPAPHPISSKQGLCVTYSSTGRVVMELKWNGMTYGWDTFVTSMPATAGVQQTLNKVWGDFKQEGWGDPQVIATALSQTEGVQFKFGGSAGATANLKIFALGWSGTCGAVVVPPIPNTSIMAQVAGSSVKASLSGRSLAFIGLGNASASIEIINLQGQVVLRDAVGPAQAALNLSRLNNGVYIVRASGKDVNFSHKVTLQ